MCELKCVNYFRIGSSAVVTPSRVCELKFQKRIIVRYAVESHTLTGVWVEMPYPSTSLYGYFCHTLTGVWVEMGKFIYFEMCFTGHTLTGVWVEIFLLLEYSQRVFVTPSRVCELKFACFKYSIWPMWSHPHGCVSWNPLVIMHDIAKFGHTLTGVWVEMALNIP